jgi:glycerol-3-phosphate dehydrogenase (NAD(P)+)
MRMVAEGVRTSSTVVQLADRYGLQMPIARTINDVVTGRIRAADAYRGLIRSVPAGHESQPG